MLSLHSLLPSIKQAHRTGTKSVNTTRSSRIPVLRNRPRREHYYLDASWHTRKSFRALRDADRQPSGTIGPRPVRELLAAQVDTLLYSIRPELPDDGASKALYLTLLSRQLNAIDADTLQWLAPALKQEKYDCYVTETVIDDEMYIDHGFANGPPHSRQRTVLTSAEFHEALDHAGTTAQSTKAQPRLALSAAQAQETRDQLAMNALRWKASDKSLTCLHDMMQTLATALGVATGAPLLTSTTALPGASTLEWRDGRWVIDGDTANALQHPDSAELFARVQRDMLEGLLLSKLPHSAAEAGAGRASHALWLSLWQTIEHIEQLPPSMVMTPERRHRLRLAMPASAQRGRIQIMPTVGAALGHAWIRPRLSIAPEKTALAESVGNRYMHGGGQPQPRHSTINEWPIRWLTAAEMEEWHPSHEAWHLDVPVDAAQLDKTTHELEHEWKAGNRRYRFAEVAPDKPASGCRISVWESVQRGMSPPVRECFDEFNRGLPLPGTPTELWERLENFNRWLIQVVSD